MSLNTSTLSAADRQVYKLGVWRWTGVLQDQTGAALSVSDVTAVTLTIRDQATGELLVDGRDIKNANAGTLDTDGNQVVVISGTDNRIVNDQLAEEEHLVTIEYTWDSGLKRHWHAIPLTVLNNPDVS